MRETIDEENGFKGRIIAFVVVLALLFAANGYVLYRLFITSQSLVDARKETFVKEFKGTADVLDEYLGQRMANLNTLTNNTCDIYLLSQSGAGDVEGIRPHCVPE